MRHKMSCFEYNKERDDDLLRSYHEALDSEYTDYWNLMTRVVNSQSKRFWVSEERATCVIRSMMYNEGCYMPPTKKEMFEEIYRRVVLFRDIHPDKSLSYIVRKVISQPAPKFYLTPKSASVIIHYIKKRWLEQRKQRLRHLL